MLKEAIDEIYQLFPYEYSLKYSGKFKPYRANIKLRYNTIELNLSKAWKTVSKEIQIGLAQELLLKLLKKRVKPIKTTTESIELYNIFLKKLHLGTPKTETDPVLEESFNRVNDNYFYGLIEQPNLVWINAVNRLGSYEYATDTISISTILQEQTDLIDYVMYHELLHKKHKFHVKNGRSFHHTHQFRKDERGYPHSEQMEKRLNNLVRQKKRRLFRFW